MISVVVYGRNDSHGYNLHKRAAISLNCIARKLTAADDEILFVDYNTPDDLPTFPEAIADTLTEEARRRLRIFRVRPAVHQRFAHLTHLPVLEPIARNVAIRRSNPANRWVLATNTDMIFRTEPESASLSEIAAELEDGFYHTARLELPESVWEAFDRRDPDRILAEIDSAAARLHLHFVTLGIDDVLYDAPGDFQLMLRSDLFAIDSFHEGMLLGWHLDANIARRLRLHRAPVSSLLHAVHAYHCDHTRQATLIHGKKRENNFAAYVDLVAQAALPLQRETWGLPGEEIEEIRLYDTRSRRFADAVGNAIGAPQQGFETPPFIGDHYNNLAYDPRHALPFLIDQFTCLPPGRRIGLFTMREDTARYVADAMARLDPDSRLLAPSDWPWLAVLGGNVEAATQDRIRAEADVFVFEMGVPAHGEAAAALRLPALLSAHEELLDAERSRMREGQEPRRLIAVNATHNTLERVWMEHVNYTHAPYSTRVRQGFVRPEPQGAADADTAPLKEIVAQLTFPPRADDAAWAAAAQTAPPLRALLEAGALGLTPDRAETLTRFLATAHEAKNDIEPLKPLGRREGRSASACRLADPSDWDDPRFLSWLRRLQGGSARRGWFARDLWTWERAALLAALDLKPDAGAERRRVLVLGRDPEILAAVLAGAGAKVDIADPNALIADGLAPRDWRNEVDAIDILRFEPLGRYEPNENGARYDAIVATQNSLLVGGKAQAASVLAALDAMLKPNGVLVAACHVRLAGTAEAAFGASHIVGDTIGAGVAKAGPYERLGPFDAALSSAALDRVGAAGSPYAPPPFIDASDNFSSIGLWGWRKIGDGAFDPAALAAVFGGASAVSASEGKRFQMGSQMRHLRAGEGVALTPMSLRASAPKAGATLAEAELGTIEPGPYELVIEGRAGNGDPSAAAFAVTARHGQRVLLQRAVSAADFARGRVVIPFEVAEDGAALDISLNGGAGAIELTELAVR